MVESQIGQESPRNTLGLTGQEKGTLAGAGAPPAPPNVYPPSPPPEARGVAQGPASPVGAASPVGTEDLDIEQDCLDLLYAPSIVEDWEGLRDLTDYMRRRKPQVVILTSVLLNPLDQQEKVAFQHANRYVMEAFRKDGNFSDIELYLESFRNDPAQDIVAVSARKILAQIESGKKVVREKLETFQSIFSRCPCPYYIIPGRYENVDLIRSLEVGDLGERYLNVRKTSERGFAIMGVGGLPGLADDCPTVFQDKEYFDGSEVADEYLRDVIGDDVDVLVSYAPIRHFTDPGEEALVRNFISSRLPGKVILTSQTLSDYERAILTASGAELIRGGSFGKGKAATARTFWELLVGRSGIVEKSLFELKMKKAFRML